MEKLAEIKEWIIIRVEESPVKVGEEKIISEDDSIKGTYKHYVKKDDAQ